jgi:predicted dinucleotide-binding enzyme
MTKLKVGILGDGHVGSALARGIGRAGYEVNAVGSERGAMRQLVDWAELVVLAVPFVAIDQVIEIAGAALAGKPLVDVTNALAPDMTLAVGFTTSGAENLQRKLPKARVVKAFNAVFADLMATGTLGGQRLTTFAASDDAEAKDLVLVLAREIGFDAIDAGPLVNARLLEPLGALNLQLGYSLKMGTEVGFRFLHG